MLSAWYHIVVAVDTTQGTAANRIKFMLMEYQETTFATVIIMDQNYDFALNAITDQTTHIGKDLDQMVYFDGYLSEFVALMVTICTNTFGEFDEDSGIWKPIDVSGLTFGDEWILYEFSNSSRFRNRCIW